MKKVEKYHTSSHPGVVQYLERRSGWFGPLLDPTSPLQEHLSPSPEGVGGTAAAFLSHKKHIQVTRNVSGCLRGLGEAHGENSLFFVQFSLWTP